MEAVLAGGVERKKGREVEKRGKNLNKRSWTDVYDDLDREDINIMHFNLCGIRFKDLA